MFLKKKAMLTLVGIAVFSCHCTFTFFPTAAALGPFLLEGLGMSSKHKLPQEYLCTFSFQLDLIVKIK